MGQICQEVEGRFPDELRRKNEAERLMTRLKAHSLLPVAGNSTGTRLSQTFETGPAFVLPEPKQTLYNFNMSDGKTLLRELIESQPGGKRPRPDRYMNDAEYEHFLVALNQLEIEIEQVSIFRSIRAYKKIRELRSFQKPLRIELNTWVGTYEVRIDPRSLKDMFEPLELGEAYWMNHRIVLLRTRWHEVFGALDQKASATFNIFTLYVAGISILVSVLLGVAGLALGLLPLISH